MPNGNGPPIDSLANALWWLGRFLADVAAEFDYYGTALSSFGGIGVPLATLCYNVSSMFSYGAQAVLKASTYARAVETAIGDMLTWNMLTETGEWLRLLLVEKLGVPAAFLDDPDGWVLSRLNIALIEQLTAIRDDLYTFLQRLLRYFLEGVWSE